MLSHLPTRIEIGVMALLRRVIKARNGVQERVILTLVMMKEKEDTDYGGRDISGLAFMKMNNTARLCAYREGKLDWRQERIRGV